MAELQFELPMNLENLQLPDPGLFKLWQLEEDRMYYIDYEIDETVLEIQQAIILHNKEDKGIPVEDRKPIIIMLDTPGGLLAETMSVASTMIMSKTPVYTVNVAEAYSGGGLLLLAGHKRFCFPYSKAMLHTGGRSGGGGTFEQTEAAQKLYKKQVQEMCDYIIERTQMDSKLFNKNRTKDWYFDAKEQEEILGCSIVKNLEEII